MIPIVDYNYNNFYVYLFYIATITQHPEGTIIDLYTNNFNLTLKCRATGLQLEYSWTKNNAPIIPSDRYMIGPDLVIINVTPSDTGSYQCIVNSVNTAVSSRFATVIVKGESNVCLNFSTHKSTCTVKRIC